LKKVSSSRFAHICHFGGFCTALTLRSSIFPLVPTQRTEIHLTLEINGFQLEQFEDYTLEIVEDTRLQLQLNEGKEWWGKSKKTGSLILKKAVFDASPLSGTLHLIPHPNAVFLPSFHLILLCVFPLFHNTINLSAWG
jgi:hypothetical protein